MIVSDITDRYYCVSISKLIAVDTNIKTACILDSQQYSPMMIYFSLFHSVGLLYIYIHIYIYALQADTFVFLSLYINAFI